MSIVNWQKSTRLTTSVSLGVLLALLGSVNVPLLSQVTTDQSNRVQTNQEAATLPIVWSYDPGDRGSPARRAGAGSRGGCLLGSPRLTALLPPGTSEELPALTVDADPAFFWAMPRVKQTATIELRLWDESRPLYSKTLTPTKEAGIISFQVAKDAKAAQLKTGETYRWSVSVRCNPRSHDRSGDQFVEGWVKRVAVSQTLQQDIALATNDRDLAQAYAQAGIWHNTLATLALRQRQHGQEGSLATTDWQGFLNSADLGVVAEANLLEKP